MVQKNCTKSTNYLHKKHWWCSTHVSFRNQQILYSEFQRPRKKCHNIVNYTLKGRDFFLFLFFMDRKGSNYWQGVKCYEFFSHPYLLPSLKFTFLSNFLKATGFTCTFHVTLLIKEKSLFWLPTGILTFEVSYPALSFRFIHIHKLQRLRKK